MPEDSCIVLKETVYKGKIRPWGKTPESLCRIHIPVTLAADFAAWKLVCPNSTPDGFIFPNRDGDFLDPNNYCKRVSARLRETLGLPKLDFRVIRRTIATLSQTKGNLKDSQGLLRHAKLPTTANVYVQVIPEGVVRMIYGIGEELRKPSKLQVVSDLPRKGVRKRLTAKSLGAKLPPKGNCLVEKFIG